MSPPPGAPLLSVAVPVFNEAPTLRAAIERLHSLPISIEVIAVDDGSSDGSGQILAALREEQLVHHLISQPRNLGKGRAIRSALTVARGDVFVIYDADLEYDPGDLLHLLEPIMDGRADAVFGSRFLAGPRRVLYFWHRVGNGLLTLLSNMLTDINLTDMETGYKMIRTDLARALPLRAERFGIEVELTARLAQARARIFEVPIRYDGRTYAEGKKIDWKDGLAALWHIFRFNLLPPRASVYPGPSLRFGTQTPLRPLVRGESAVTEHRDEVSRSASRDG